MSNPVGRSIVIALFAGLRLSAAEGGTAQDPATTNSPIDLLDRYNVVWDSPSKDSGGSMPLGNGDIGVNAWVEENGDLLFFISKTDAWSDCGRLLKLGQVRVRLTPSLPVQPFFQELQLRQGQMVIPFADGVATFYDQHWKRDQKGKIRLDPACALESCHNAVNPLPEIAGLTYVLPRLLVLPSEAATTAQRAAWTKTLADLFEVPMRGDAGKKICVAAEVIKDRQGDELPELYGVFPYRLYALGCPDFDIGRRSVETYVPTQPRTVYPLEGKVGGWRLNLIQVAFVGKADQAARMVTSNFASHDPGSRFPAFWGPNQVGKPDQSHGGVSMTALQAMLLQVDGRKIYLFPAWPRSWDVRFKLHALYSTTVEGVLRDGKVTTLKVTPRSRAVDVVNMLAN